MNLLIVAQVLGIILTVSGLSLIFNKKGASMLIGELSKNPGILWFTGFIILVMGAVLVSIENVWGGSSIQVLITILGWLTLIKGSFIILFPNSTISLSNTWNKRGLFVVSGVGALLIGVILLYSGFM